jgi:nucleoid-associated protein YgaU
MFDLKEMAEKALKAKVEEVVRGRVRDLEVIVNGTEVTIRGEVETAADKQAVLADVQNVEGLTKIVTGLSVAEEVRKAEAEKQTYTVQAGDTLWGIAQKLLGNGALYTKIYEANKDVIGSNPDLIKVGMVLKIPQ